ncbi:N-acetylmuramoyl-L-alanine amidase [Brachybacterium sp. AOP25-B2-12]|uniref:N-acetylmuramoyl-L-alanine amidase n=1 Tax=Brachybacterium sp. AOP25-B2-12 TaxID=3457710 RepID=UPI004033EF04
MTPSVDPDSTPTSLTRRCLIAAGLVSIPFLATAGPAVADPGDDGTTIVDVPLADQPLATSDSGATVRVVATEAATLVGCTWSGEQPDEIAARGELVADGSWTPWFELDELTDPEDGRTTSGTQAVWLGGPVRSIQVRATSAGSDVTAELVAHVVTTTRIAADEKAAPRPSARSAQALSSSLVPGIGAPWVVTRAGWGADESLVKGQPSYASELKAAVLHHTEGSNSYSAADVPGILRGILKYHTQSQGWNDIGYNALVDRFGTIYEGRAGGLTRHVVGAHATGSNTGTFGVSMIGSTTSAPPTDAQLNAVADVMAWKLGGSYVYDVSSTTELDDKTQPRVFGHKDARSVSTDCPGTAGYAQLPRLRGLVQGRLGIHRTSSYLAYLDKGGAARLGTVSEIIHVDGSRLVTVLSSGSTIVEAGGTVQVLDSTGVPVDLPVYGAIAARWWEAGGAAGIGRPTSLEGDAGAGRQQSFERGKITWSQGTGARVTLGAIHDRWSREGGAAGWFGLPVSEERIGFPQSGVRQDFQNTVVFFSPASGAFSLFGAIRGRYDAVEGPLGGLGYPVSQEYDISGGRAQDFQRGIIAWTPARGAVVVAGALFGAWNAQGRFSGRGAPLTAERNGLVRGGAAQDFADGTIYWSPSTGAFPVRAALLPVYRARGAENWIGYPTSTERAMGIGSRQDFERGYLTWTPAAGVTMSPR